MTLAGTDFDSNDGEENQEGIEANNHGKRYDKEIEQSSLVIQPASQLHAVAWAKIKVVHDI